MRMPFIGREVERPGVSWNLSRNMFLFHTLPVVSEVTGTKILSERKLLVLNSKMPFGIVLENYTYTSRESVTRTHIHTHTTHTHIHTHHEGQKLIETHREKVCKFPYIFTISGFWSGFYEFNGTEALFVCTRFMFPLRPDVVWRANRPNKTNTFRTMTALVFLGTVPGAVCHPRFRIALAWWIWGGCERTSW